MKNIIFSKLFLVVATTTGWATHFGLSLLPQSCRIPPK